MFAKQKRFGKEAPNVHVIQAFKNLAILNDTFVTILVTRLGFQLLSL